MTDTELELARDEHPAQAAVEAFNRSALADHGLDAQVSFLRGGGYLITVTKEKYHADSDGNAPFGIHAFLSDVEAFEDWHGALEVMDDEDFAEELEMVTDQYTTALAAGWGDWVKGTQALTRKPARA